MDNQTQDRSWACLSKEAREEVKMAFNMPSKCGYSDSVRLLLIYIFGSHNLTSNTEPDEMLMVSKSKVMERIKYLYSHPAHIAAHKADERASELRSLFGDQYLSAAPNTQNSWELKYDKDISILEISTTEDDKGLEHRLEQTSVQDEPKFKVGDKVWCKPHKCVAEIDIIGYDVKKGQYHLKFYGWFKPEDLEPYTEPEYRNESQFIPNCDKSEDNQLKDNMEEKELNLCELLKGCEGEKFFSPNYGEVILISNEKYLEFRTESGTILTSPLNVPTTTGYIGYYPSKDAFLKYPLDAYSAWMERQSERTPKRWRAKKGDNYWYIDSSCGVTIATEEGCYTDDYRHKIGNYFITKFDAVTAYGLVRSAFKRFHEK